MPSEYIKLRNNYNKAFNKAVKRLQKRCLHDMGWIPYVGEDKEICLNCNLERKVKKDVHEAKTTEFVHDKSINSYMSNTTLNEFNNDFKGHKDNSTGEKKSLKNKKKLR